MQRKPTAAALSTSVTTPNAHTRDRPVDHARKISSATPAQQVHHKRLRHDQRDGDHHPQREGKQHRGNLYDRAGVRIN
jgi:hypothetical protein